nr:class I SAM-dependent methyltransferase [Streptomyces kebangsaanensis]
MDVGAGTGIATALLHERGARAPAVEPGGGMAAQLRRTHPDIPVVRGSGDALPLADASADLLTYAQAWHWTDPARSVPEAPRVLRPGGALALWWNTDAPDVEWTVEEGRRIHRFLGADRAAESRAAGTRTDRADPSGRLRFTRREVRWSRQVPVGTHLADIGSHSYFLVCSEERKAAFPAEERDHLLRVFPDGIVEETYDVLLLLATKPCPGIKSPFPLDGTPSRALIIT